jgi:tetratricopeptide (TPR) repeat protein
MDVDAGINELVQSSFIEINASNMDDIPFLSVPLVASIFGQRKLAVDQLKSTIEADTKLLQALGAAQQSDIRHGIAPRVRNMFRHVSEAVKMKNESIDEYIPVLSFIARKYPRGWLYLASIYEQNGSQQNLDAAKDAIMRYLENPSDGEENQREAWTRLANLCRRTNNYSGEVHALLQISLLPGAAFRSCSDAVHRLNSLINQNYVLDTVEKQSVGEDLASVMAKRIDEGDATDCSRLAWLYIHLGDKQSARYFTELGLEQDPNNLYCCKLAETLSMSSMTPRV